jgi:hypothetical protein
MRGIEAIAWLHKERNRLAEEIGKLEIQMHMLQRSKAEFLEQAYRVESEIREELNPVHLFFSDEGEWWAYEINGVMSYFLDEFDLSPDATDERVIVCAKKTLVERARDPLELVPWTFEIDRNRR